MTPDDTGLDETLDRAFAGELSPEEEAAFARWLAESPEREVRVARLRAAWASIGGEHDLDSAGVLQARAAILSRVDGTVGCSPVRSKETPQFHRQERQILPRGIFSKHTLRRWPGLGRHTLWWKTGYLVSCLAGVSVVALIAFNRGGLSSTSTSFSARTYMTVAGQYSTITLADGSCAQLGPATTLSVVANSVGNHLDVRISGEALFTVVHHSNTSFQVHAGNAVTRVLGTTFLVRRYPSDRVTQVMVADGRVSLASMRSSIPRVASAQTTYILTARTFGTIDDSGNVSLNPNIAVEDYTAWMQGRLVFRNTTARDVVTELGRVYNVEIHIADSTVAAQHVNWTVQVTQRTLEDVLESLVDILDAHPIRTGRFITFMPGRSASRRSPDLPSSTPERQYGK